ncbi:aldehyde dehydrogenase (NADP(+)) [Pseudomonas sp. CBSPBW29]|uniref:aldehyde dehydrogenase (NADP(+)) n=1 Tax=Pseudomonas TaxID=286 RepID=UPI0021ACAD79|nr:MULTISPECIES: aldehyde dehydrogenase (NADP(+)) [unclassified Pseudomonas]WEL44455.1 aldehyde dehydrogenase (NADP(+)) [Pseudomonas sp. CBSPBW29]WEL65544.1 aldehyde dehydrogenase (NADP(+)) [Pseudomonas sp. CBSPGW29]WEL69013.1 aldehyde dehydrogenase (NADP(+)) [Pseudomonas sp. CBSPCGW29]WEL76015.1 aldehyde dehydrogenase (NADP(+)) [Pseudomonas sp. CBSPAW29]WEL85417.1 aldehyde dehydrogenase (NADP(+)) [Pseudomonas sp. CBSPCAW29]WEL88204.1 aldehyde dehydrogenase (NADP(+)) [Pseudomonas sp. CBSPCBW2
MTLTGTMLIGQHSIPGSREAIRAINPATDIALEPAYAGGTAEHVEHACALAWSAFDSYRETPLAARAEFLESIANEIEALGDELIERAMAETGLPRPRIQGERGRTCHQLRTFARTVRAGEWLDVRVDSAQPDRQPLPRSDLRQRQVPLGPVAVFGASNFPLAFSVAGGDTASALAAGCPVIVKAHSAHPGTSELVGRAVAKAVQQCGLPDGVFSLLYGSGREVGIALVRDPRIKAVGFTGSRSGGIALCQAAQARPEPIPVYAEMSSINPVYLFPAALKARGEALAQGFVASLTQGAGQFCTNPGLVIAVAGQALDHFIDNAANLLQRSAAQVMLTPGIFKAYDDGVSALAKHAHVAGKGLAAQGPNQGQAHLFATHAQDFLANHSLQAEIFGAASLIVQCANADEVRQVSEHLEGQLTATLHLDGDDLETARALLPTLERKAGRLLVNGWPTGVEVCDAMVHGGPFPATSDSRTTSVGTAAILRFLRPVCYQDFPDGLLPTALQHGNPLLLRRLLDGQREA